MDDLINAAGGKKETLDMLMDLFTLANCGSLLSDKEKWNIEYCIGKDNGCQGHTKRIWGTGTYTGDSSHCCAALHSGVVDSKGGFFKTLTGPSGDKF